MAGGDRTRGVALGNDLTRASFAPATLGGDAEFELNFVKAHAGARMACNFPVGDSAADADDHGGGSEASWLLVEKLGAL